jgi:transposase
MNITRGYKTELDPTVKQQIVLCQCAGVARFAYNYGLARKQEVYAATGTSISAIDLQKELTARKHTDLPWLKNVSKWIVQNSLRDLDQAYAHFFRRVREQKAGKKWQHLGFPKFKSIMWDYLLIFALSLSRQCPGSHEDSGHSAEAEEDHDRDDRRLSSPVRRRPT